jgi:hypothetical protein
VDIRRGKLNLLGKATKESGSCQMRSGTDNPCPRPAAVLLWDVLFCEACAREQEAYFAIGKLTEEPRSSRDDARLIGVLDQMRRMTRRRVVGSHRSDAA